MSTKTPQKMKVAEAKVIALAKRRDGLSYRAISEVLAAAGYKAGRSTVMNWVHAEMATLAKETQGHTAELRQMELERLDHAQAALKFKVNDGDVQAAMAWIRISERRAKLLGLDAPVQLQVEELMQSEIDQFLAFLESQISSNAFGEVLAAVQASQANAEKAALN